MIKTILTASIILLLFGCLSSRRASRLTDKILRSYPEVIAKVARDKFPCELQKIDTIISLKDSTIWVECPDSIKTVVPTFTKDSIIIKKVKILVPVNLPVKTITIVKEIEDLSKIVVIDAENAKLRVENEKMAVIQTKKNKVIKWLIFVLIGLIIPYLFKIIRLIIFKK